MIYKEIKFNLKDGREAVLRNPLEREACDLLRFIVTASGDTDFLLRRPEDFSEFTIEKELAFINYATYSKDKLMLACFVDGRIAGNCEISFRSGVKDRHRATLAIAILKEFWDLGIGTKMFEVLINAARERDCVKQLELDFVEGNDRARHLYEKMGFRITGVKPDAIRLQDGTFANEYMMIKKL